MGIVCGKGLNLFHNHETIAMNIQGSSVSPTRPFRLTLRSTYLATVPSYPRTGYLAQNNINSQKRRIYGIHTIRDKVHSHLKHREKYSPFWSSMGSR
jgi:hypothetical protein